MPGAARVNVVQPLRREPAPDAGLDPKFTRALDFKLRRLKQKELLRADLCRASRARGDGSRGASAARSPGRRPRFVTTVRCGQFLLPPPEVARLLRLHALYPAPGLVYCYGSRPEPVAARARPALQDAARPALQDAARPALQDAARPALQDAARPALQDAARPALQDAARPALQDAARPTAALLGSVRTLIASVAGFRHLPDGHGDTSGGGGGGGGGGAAPYANVMHDKRVVRGSTYGAHTQAAGDGLQSAAAAAAHTRRRALARRAAAARLRPASPPPAPGRRHRPIQTDCYLQELFAKGAELEAGVQTDLARDRPASPRYLPARTGADRATQLAPGDLFDFDLEVQPVLEVLVGKTAEQALAEVAQEEELGALREQQRRYRELRDAERAERQRLQAQDARLAEERSRRVQQAGAARAAAGEARARAAAAVLVQGYVAELLPAVLAGLRSHGYLLERLERAVQDDFLAWLVAQVSLEVSALGTARDVLGGAVRDVVEARAALYRGAAPGRAAPTPEDSLTPPSQLYGEDGEDAEDPPE